MFWRKKVKDNHITDTDLSEIEPQRRTLKAIIDGKLYDTSQATHLCHVLISNENIPEYALIISRIGGEDTDVYKGVTEFFIEYSGVIQPVTEDWVKEVLGKCNVDKYIELFGKPELA